MCATQPYELGAHCRWEGHALEPSEFRAACGTTGKRRSPRAESPLLERVALSLRFTSAKPSACLAAPEKDRQPLQYPAELLVWVGSALLSDAAGDLPQDADRASGPRPCGLSDHREKVNTHRGALPVSVQVSAFDCGVVFRTCQWYPRRLLHHSLPMDRRHGKVQGSG